jgi:DNA-binding NarL/FixJ family response regulator
MITKSKWIDPDEFMREVSKLYFNSSIDNNDNFVNNNNLRDCYYIIDFSKNKITYMNGFDNLLDYKNQDITLDFLASKVHDDDKEMVNKIRIASTSFALNNPTKECDYKLSLTYRLKNNNNTYINVFNQTTIHEADESGRVISVLNKLSDVSFMHNHMNVNWLFEGNHLDIKSFKKEIYREYQSLFTTRELDVINKIANGFTSKIISEKLNISEHTVATHRKRILKKSKCHNSDQLLLFCSKNGIL